MADNAVTDAKDVEPPGSFDPDAWGASPHWEPTGEQSVYDDDDLDRERVPLARSLLADLD